LSSLLGFIQEIRQTKDVNTLRNMTDDNSLFQVGYRKTCDDTVYLLYIIFQSTVLISSLNNKIMYINRFLIKFILLYI